MKHKKPEYTIEFHKYKDLNFNCPEHSGDYAPYALIITGNEVYHCVDTIISKIPELLAKQTKLF